jgi:predicted PurR-regulated permease PerM
MATGHSHLAPAATSASAPRPPRAGRTTARLIAVVTVLLAVFALKLSRPVSVPIAVAIFVVVLAWPLQARLERRMPRKLAYAATVLAVFLVLALFVGALFLSVRAIAEEAPRYQPKIEQLRTQLQAWAERHGIPISSAGGGERAVEQGLAVATRIATAAYSALGTLVIVLAFTLLGLLEVRDFRTKVRRRLSGSPAGRLIEVSGEIATSFRRYFLVKTLTSAITGVATGLLALAFGLDFAFVFGLAAFLLEYVPTLGSIVAIVPPSVFAFLQFPGLAKPLGVAAAFTVLQITLGNIVDPRIEGRYMSLSPVLVLLSIVFWAWVWGPAGALLGVPLTVAVAVVCEHFQATRWIPALLTEVSDDERRQEEDEQRSA